MVVVRTSARQAQTKEIAMILGAILGSASDRLIYWWTRLRVAYLTRRVRALDALTKSLNRDAK